MKFEYFYSIIISILVILAISLVVLLILSKMPNQTELGRQAQLTYDKCCGGNQCKDTYYSEEDGKCHSTFEWNLPTKWYITLPIVFGIAIALTLILRFIPIEKDKLPCEDKTRK